MIPTFFLYRALAKGDNTKGPQALFNKLFNPQGDTPDAVESVLNKYTGAGLTGAEVQQNQYTAQREDTQAQRAVQDYKAAGLNPALMFQNGAGGDYASQSASGVAGSGSLGDMVQALTLPLQLQQMKANIELTKANALRAGADTDYKKQQTQNLLSELDNIKQDLRNKIATEELTMAQTRQIMKALDWADRINAAVVAESESRTNLQDWQRKRIEELLENEKLLQVKTLQDFDERWKQMHAEIAKLAAETDLTQLDVENYMLFRMSNGVNGSGFSLQNLLRLIKEFDKKHPNGEGIVPSPYEPNPTYGNDNPGYVGNAYGGGSR